MPPAALGNLPAVPRLWWLPAIGCCCSKLTSAGCRWLSSASCWLPLAPPGNCWLPLTFFLPFYGKNLKISLKKYQNPLCFQHFLTETSIKIDGGTLRHYPEPNTNSNHIYVRTPIWLRIFEEKQLLQPKASHRPLRAAKGR